MQLPEEIVRRVSDQIKKTRVDCVLIGGFAVKAYEYSRDTQDIDFLIREDDFKTLEKALLTAGFSEKQKTALFTRFQHSAAKSFPVDFLSVDSDTFAAILKAGKKTTLAGRSFIIPSVQHLLALKLHALKQGQEHRYQKDMLDVLELVRLHKIDVDAPQFKDMCLRYGSRKIYEKIKFMRA